MAAVPFGQYTHSNQPSHHLLYLFAHAGPARSTAVVGHGASWTLYSPGGFGGDEDTGSMAAWYSLSALGVYQSYPGVPEYTFGSSVFLRATVYLPNRKTPIVEAPKQFVLQYLLTEHHSSTEFPDPASTSPPPSSQQAELCIYQITSPGCA